MELFQEDWIFLLHNEKAISSKELFELIGPKLINKGLAKKEYTKSLNEREKVFPTGLEAQPYPIAIPHTESEFVNQSGIVLVRSDQPIMFSNMIDQKQKMAVYFIFFLLVKDCDKQVAVIQQVMDIANDWVLMKKIHDAKNEAQIFQLVKQSSQD